MGKFHIKKQMQKTKAHAQNRLITNEHNKFKIIKIECELNEYSNYII